MKIGYVRISTNEQNTARQDVIMGELGVEKVFTDTLSGKSTDRPELHKMMDFVREGDSVIVESFFTLCEKYNGLVRADFRIRKERGTVYQQKGKP